MQNITVDLVPGRVPEIIRVSQYDKNIRAFEVKITYGDQPYTIPDGSTVAVAGTKPDGYSFDYECQYTGNTVSVTVTEQMTVCAGKTPCEVIIYDSEANRIGTANFILLVEESAMDEEKVVSGRDVPIFTEAVAEVIKDRNEADASQKAAATSEANAKASEKAALKSQRAALASEQAAKVSEEASAKSEKNAKVSEEHAKTSEENSAASAKLSESWAVGGTATREDEDQNNSKYYAEEAEKQAKIATEKQEAASMNAMAAKDSEDAAFASQQAASASEKAAAVSEKNAKSCEELAAQSEQNAKTSETSALESKESASTSELNAAASAKLSESWAKGGTSSRDGEDENNAMYYADLASASADAAAKSRDSIGAVEDNCSKSAEAAKESEEAAAQFAARFDDSDTSREINQTDFISMIASDGNRYRKLVSDVADTIIKRCIISELSGANQSVSDALNKVGNELLTINDSFHISAHTRYCWHSSI